MDAKTLESAEKTTLLKERSSLRSFISCCHGELLAGSPLDLESITRNYARLCEINRLIVGDLLAQDMDPTSELDKHAQYSSMISKIQGHFKPKVVHNKPMDIKLPKVSQEDPASWLNFKSMLDMLSKHQQMSDEEKMLQLANALPPSVAVKVHNKPFKEAVTTVTKHFESPEALIEAVRTKFRGLTRVTDSIDINGLKKLLTELEAAVSLTSDVKVQEEAFKRAVVLIPRPMYFAFVDVNAELTTAELKEFIRQRVKGLELLESAEGSNLTSTRATASKGKKSTFTSKDNLKSAGKKKPEEDAKVEKDKQKSKWIKQVKPEVEGKTSGGESD